MTSAGLGGDLVPLTGVVFLWALPKRCALRTRCNNTSAALGMRSRACYFAETRLHRVKALRLDCYSNRKNASCAKGVKEELTKPELARSGSVEWKAWQTGTGSAA